jgi:hypothetical protein
MRAVLSVLLSAIVVGCSNAVSPTLINGTWARDFGGIPGNSFEMNLAASGSNVSGAGTWSGEACCSGTLTVTGTIESNGAVHLDFTQTITAPASGATILSHFDGTIVFSQMRGKLLQHDPPNLNGVDVSYFRE